MDRRIVTTIAFDQRADAELSRLVVATGAASKAEVVRHAVSLYGFIERELSQGGELVIEHGNLSSKIFVPGLRSNGNFGHDEKRVASRRPREVGV